MFGFILSVIGGGITGGIARAILPGTQDIGWPKTIGVGMLANFVVGLTLGWILGPITGFVAGIIAGIGILSFAIQKGYLNPGNEPRRLN